MLSLGTHDKPRDSTSKHVTHPKYSDCEYKFSKMADGLGTKLNRTDKAVLAVNGFAADGNMFVKRLKNRLEVRSCRLIKSDC